MKKLILMTFLMVGMTIVAQSRNSKSLVNRMGQFTSEQRSELQVKKLTLQLDLNESQQKEMKLFIADKNSKMKANRIAMKAMKEKGTKPSTDERFAMKMKMLDEQIANKKRMQKILDAKQYEKWVALKDDQRDGFYRKNQGKYPKNQQRRI